MRKQAKTLRSYLADRRSRLMVSAYDALTARIAEEAGFEVLHLTGYGASAAIAGAPDIGLLTMTEMVEACARITDAVDRPLVADADTGYGNALNVRRTIRAFERAGAAGVHLEDQVTPKRCGHMAGKSLISCGEMVAKIHAAVDARCDDDFVVVARTDARAVEGLQAALVRARAYREAGADMLFVEAPQSEEEIEIIARELPGPQLFNWAYDGVTPHVQRRWLASLGFSLVLYADVAFAVQSALTSFYARLAAADSLDELSDALTGFDAFNEFVRLSQWRALEGRYAVE